MSVYKVSPLQIFHLKCFAKLNNWVISSRLKAQYVPHYSYMSWLIVHQLMCVNSTSSLYMIALPFMHPSIFYHLSRRRSQYSKQRCSHLLGHLLQLCRGEVEAFTSQLRAWIFPACLPRLVLPVGQAQSTLPGKHPRDILVRSPKHLIWLLLM